MIKYLKYRLSYAIEHRQVIEGCSRSQPETELKYCWCRCTGVHQLQFSVNDVSLWLRDFHWVLFQKDSWMYLKFCIFLLFILVALIFPTACSRPEYCNRNIAIANRKFGEHWKILIFLCQNLQHQHMQSIIYHYYVTIL